VFASLCNFDLAGSCGGLNRIGGAAKGSPRYLCTILEEQASYVGTPFQMPLSRVTVGTSAFATVSPLRKSGMALKGPIMY
jgi:hypothetical protein